jgi:uncharacterized glyoxalase superfamily protein PhnB
MTYRKASEAIDWLCRVFGFQKHAVYPGPDGVIMHCELTFDGGMIMLGSVRDNDYQRVVKPPSETESTQTQSINLVVQDADAIYAKVKEAGGRILLDIEDKPYGGRGFTCSDPEGHVWNIGTYDPWAPK